MLISDWSVSILPAAGDSFWSSSPRAQLSIMMQTTRVLRYWSWRALWFSGGLRVDYCFWTFIFGALFWELGPLSLIVHWLSKLGYVCVSRRLTPPAWLCLFQFIHSSHLPKHQQYVAKETSVTGTDGELKLNTTKSSLHGQRSRSFWAFCLLLTAAVQLTSANMLIDNTSS